DVAHRCAVTVAGETPAPPVVFRADGLVPTHVSGAGAAGVASALVAAISPFYVFYAQEAAQYSLLLVLALLPVWLLLRLLGGLGGCRGLWAGFLATSVAGLYTQYYFGFLLAGEGLFLLGAAVAAPSRWRLLLGWLGMMAAAGLLFLPWLPYLHRQAQLA